MIVMWLAVAANNQLRYERTFVMIDWKSNYKLHFVLNI